MEIIYNKAKKRIEHMYIEMVDETKKSCNKPKKFGICAQKIEKKIVNIAHF